MLVEASLYGYATGVDLCLYKIVHTDRSPEVAVESNEENFKG